MKLTNKQIKELEIIKEYIPSNCDWEEETEEGIQKFFEWSEQGKHKDEALIKTYLKEGRTYFHALLWGKRWRERHRAGI